MSRSDKKLVVEAPAFNLTKVMATVVPLVAAMATAATQIFEGEGFTPSQVSVMAVAVVAFLAVVTAADVLARAWSTSAKLQADALSATSAVTIFSHGIPANLEVSHEAGLPILVMASSGERCLVTPEHQPSATPTWVSVGDVRFRGNGRDT